MKGPTAGEGRKGTGCPDLWRGPAQWLRSHKAQLPALLGVEDTQLLSERWPGTSGQQGPRDINQDRSTATSPDNLLASNKVSGEAGKECRLPAPGKVEQQPWLSSQGEQSGGLWKEDGGCRW